MSAARSRNIAKLQTEYALHRESIGNATMKRRKLLYRRLTAFFFLAGIISYLMVSTYLTQMSVLEEKITLQKGLEKELGSLVKQQQILEEEIVKLNNDEYIAKLARKEYFLSEGNEIIFNLPIDGD